ncbi:hypothetical protein FH972_023905 [Carpinus fangiana]|uniref:6-phosphogluconolactonase n=1 Tax=Carpinus fangiana TaxID=176857 RepID=A0A5N6KWW3_9ROSI|nr:hypothetical protein FH972_023905 [Carpinus fangiana]
MFARSKCSNRDPQDSSGYPVPSDDMICALKGRAGPARRQIGLSAKEAEGRGEELESKAADVTKAKVLPIAKHMHVDCATFDNIDIDAANTMSNQTRGPSETAKSRRGRRMKWRQKSPGGCGVPLWALVGTNPPLAPDRIRCDTWFVTAAADSNTRHALGRAVLSAVARRDTKHVAPSFPPSRSDVTSAGCHPFDRRDILPPNASLLASSCIRLATALVPAWSVWTCRNSAWSPALIMASTAAVAYASNLYVSSYSGDVSVLSLSGSQLDIISTQSGCAPSPSWLMLDKPNNLLYCVDENLSGDDGSINSFSIADDHSLSQTSRESTSPGPVSSVLYGNGNSALAVAHYGPGGAVSAFNADNTTGVGALINQIDFKLDQPGPNPNQDDSHAHEVILDPSGKYILTPDLGADLVRVFTFDDSNAITEVSSSEISLEPGTGPRHAAFLSSADDLYLYVACELSNKLLGYRVSYNDTGISFEQVEATNTFGGGDIPANAAAAEIAVTPDQKFLIVSNRMDASFDGSDSLATFKPAADGSLEFVELYPVGGLTPRQFSINGDGSLVAVGLQGSSKVNLLQRDLSTGKFTGTLASVDVAGEVTCVVWDE